MTKSNPVRNRIRETMADREYPEQRIGQMIEPQANGCWIFRSDPDTYGVIHAYNGQEAAHRWVYKTLVGSIPRGHHLHHLCRTKGCVNPGHLLPVSASVHGKIHNA